MKVLVTGGAGYVGSVVVEELLKEGHEVVVLDNLSQGHREAVLPEARFVLGDLSNRGRLAELLSEGFDAVMHMAAETVIEYSMSDPRRYFETNVIGGINLLEAMLQTGCRRLVFSSSAAVYGEPKSIPIEEEHPQNPVNAYGESKLMFEHILHWYGRAYGLQHISLRYFNAAGATEKLGEDHRPETHLIPNVLKVALAKSSRFKVQGSGLGGEDIRHQTLNIESGTSNVEPVKIFGTDYPTKDGSCIRDYIHVVDIAQAHLLALQKLDQSSKVQSSTLNLERGTLSTVYNLGNGEGYSVLEVIEVARKVTGVDIPAKPCPRRPGDPAVLVASSRKAKEELGWKPRFPELEAIIESAWKWIREHPSGYTS